MLYVSVGMIGTAAVVAFIVHLNFTLTLPTFYFLLASIVLVLLYSIPPFHFVNRGFGELFLAIHIGYIVPSIAFLLQAGENSRLLTALLIPLTVLALAYFLVVNFTTFLDDQKYERGTLLRFLTWERAIPLHHGIIIFAYLMFALAPLLVFPSTSSRRRFSPCPSRFFKLSNSAPLWAAIRQTGSCSHLRRLLFSA